MIIYTKKETFWNGFLETFFKLVLMQDMHQDNSTANLDLCAVNKQKLLVYFALIYLINSWQQFN